MDSSLDMRDDEPKLSSRTYFQTRLPSIKLKKIEKLHKPKYDKENLTNQTIEEKLKAAEEKRLVGLISYFIVI